MFNQLSSCKAVSSYELSLHQGVGSQHYEGVLPTHCLSQPWHLLPRLQAYLLSTSILYRGILPTLDLCRHQCLNMYNAQTQCYQTVHVGSWYANAVSKCRCSNW